MGVPEYISNLIRNLYTLKEVVKIEGMTILILRGKTLQRTYYTLTACYRFIFQNKSQDFCAQITSFSDFNHSLLLG